MNVVVQASMVEDQIEIRPLGFLGEAVFVAYKAACSGAKYDRARKCQVTSRKRWPAIRQVLSGAGFVVVEAPEVVSSRHKRTVPKESAETLDTRVSAAEERTGLVLYGYQREGVAFLAAREGALLADEQGLGKTLETLLAIPQGSSVLVVVPAIAQGVWRDAVASLRPEFSVVSAKEVGALPSPQAGRFSIATYEDVVGHLGERKHAPRWARCTSSDAMHDRLLLLDAGSCLPGGLPCSGGKTVDWGTCPERSPMVARIHESCAWIFGGRCPKGPTRTVPAYDVLIADEAHYLKNDMSQRSKQFRRLSDQALRVWLLTGTPLPSTPPELWHVLDAANLATAAFDSFEAFATLFGAEEKLIERYNPKTRERKTIRFLEWPKDRAPDIESKLSDEASARLAGLMLRRTKASKLDLPDKIFRVVPIRLPKPMEALLEEARRAILEATGVDLLEDEDLDESVPFHQIASVRAQIAKAKVPWLLDLLDLHEEAGEKVLVFSSHLDPLRAVIKRKGWARITGETPGKERGEAERAFQAGELLGLACSTRAAGTALTLHRATVEVFVDWDWVPANNAQAIDRAHRIGLDHTLVVESLVSDHPIDRHVSEVLARKSRLISTTFSKVER